MKLEEQASFIKYTVTLAIVLFASQVCLGQTNQKAAPKQPATQGTRSTPNASPNTAKTTPATPTSGQQSSATTDAAGTGFNAGAMAQQARQLQLDSDATNLVEARSQAMAAQDEANKAAFHAGELAATDSTSRGNIQKRLQGVKAALEHMQHSTPNSYTSAAPRVALTDPFKAVNATNESGTELGRAVEGTCLELDKERGVARVASSCANHGCGDRFAVGDYPVLSDGNILDTVGRIHEFLQECRSPAVSAVRLS
jgi:hypothetical protein